MPRRFTDSDDSRDYNWCRLWEPPSKKSQRRYARAWVHPLPGVLPISKALATPNHSNKSPESTMSSNPKNESPKDQFLSWRQDKEAKQEEQARLMAELHEQTNHLREENERLRNRLDSRWVEHSRELPRPPPPFHSGKGKETALSDDIDLPAYDELSSGSSPLRRRSPS